MSITAANIYEPQRPQGNSLTSLSSIFKDKNMVAINGQSAAANQDRYISDQTENFAPLTLNPWEKSETQRLIEKALKDISNGDVEKAFDAIINAIDKSRSNSQADHILSRFEEKLIKQGYNSTFDPVSYTHLTLPTTPYV